MNNQRISADAANRNDVLSRHLGRANDQSRDLPSRWAGGSSSTYRLEIIGGNTLSDGSTPGIAWASGGLTTVPVIYDPNVDTTFVTGIGNAYLYIDNVIQANKVLVANYSGNGSPWIRALVVSQLPYTTASLITLPLVSDATQTNSFYLVSSP